ncbi:MAG: sialate O-acetylesterase [Granulosicoccus sp.]
MIGATFSRRALGCLLLATTGFVFQAGYAQQGDGSSTTSDIRSADIDAIASYPTRILSRSRWSLISIPADPGPDGTVEALFGDDLPVEQYGAAGTWVIYAYDIAGGVYRSVELLEPLSANTAYWMLQQQADSVEIDIPDGLSAPNVVAQAGCLAGRVCVSVPLTRSRSQSTWNFIGYSSDSRALFGQTRFLTASGACANGCTPAEALAADVSSNAMYRLNSVGDAYQLVTESTPMRPWDGYWLLIPPGDGPLEWVVPVVSQGVVQPPPIAPVEPLTAADVDFFAFAGQSNASLHFARLDRDTDFLTGAAVFGSRIAMLSGFPTETLDVARGGSGSSEFANETDYWWNLGTDTPGPVLIDAVMEIRANLASGQDLDGIVWSQGEEDALGVLYGRLDAAVAVSSFRESTRKTFAYLRSQFDPELPIFIQELGNFPEPVVLAPGQTSAFELMRSVHSELIAADPLLFFGADSSDLPYLVDRIHYTTKSYGILADELAETAYSVISGSEVDRSRLIEPPLMMSSQLSFEATITARFDTLSGGYQQPLFDFGNGPAADNILLSQAVNSDDMRFVLWAGERTYFIEALDAITPGVFSSWRALVDRNGVMQLYKNGILLAEGQGIPVPDVQRVRKLIGQSSFPEDTPLVGQVLSLSIDEDGDGPL